MIRFSKEQELPESKAVKNTRFFFKAV